MPFTSETATGRPKGVGNKSTEKLREAIAAITEGGIESFNECMDEVRTTNPAKYMEIYLKLLEYSMPKLRSIDTNIGVNEDSVSGITIQVVKQANGDNNSSK